MKVSQNIVNQKWSQSMDFLNCNINIYQDKPMLVLPITYQKIIKHQMHERGVYQG